MASPTELIDALRRRARALRPQRPAGEMPEGWSAWFAAMAARPGGVTGASADAIAATLAKREPAAGAGQVPAIGRWRAFNALWRQQWQPVGRDERWLRITGYASSFLIHLVLMLLLLWLALVRLAPPPTSAPEGIDAVQVEFLGDGTPEDTGGGAAAPADTPSERAPATATAAAVVPAAVAPADASPATAATPVVSPPSSTPSPSIDHVVQVVEIPRTPPPQPPAPQPLVVTQVAVPDTSFVLPPPTPPVLRPVQVQAPVPRVRAPAAETRVVDIPAPVEPVVVVTPPAPTPPAPQPPVPVPVPSPPDPVVQEVPEPLQVPTIATPTLRAPPSAAPQGRAQAVEARTRDIPTPATATGTTSSATPAAATASGSAPASTASGTASQPGTQAAGRGPAANAPPGAQPGPKRGDDWAASDRNRPGGQAGRAPGLFNADGSPRLAPGSTAAAGGGLPPGTIRQDIVDLDHAGSWLKRKPNDFETTSLDQYWVPSESLLAEWVRRSIKEVLIPVPGTSKTIKCSVVLLAFGGGCGISSPDMQDIEATARPPPDIPFKRELQEPPRPPPGG